MVNWFSTEMLFHWGKKSFQKMLFEKLSNHFAKKEFGPLTYTTQKI